MTISKPDPAKVAQDRLAKSAAGEQSPAVPATEKRGRGRPKGSTNKPKDGTQEKERTAEEIKQGAQICSFLSATIWGITASVTKHRDITDEEAQQLGAALDPVLHKYLPGISGYALEINLLVVVGVIWQATAPPKKEENKPGVNTNTEPMRLVPAEE